MDKPSNEAFGTLSKRGHSYATGTTKTLENVINNLWDPKDNPDGFVSLGLAENVLQSFPQPKPFTVADDMSKSQALMHEELTSFVKDSVRRIPLDYHRE